MYIILAELEETGVVAFWGALGDALLVLSLEWLDLSMMGALMATATVGVILDRHLASCCMPMILSSMCKMRCTRLVWRLGATATTL